MRADVRAEHMALVELRKIEGPRPKALPDWPKCENCGEPYGPHAIGPHTKRCKKMLPHGANGYGPQDHYKNPKFAQLYRASNLGVEEKANEGAFEAMQQGLQGLGKSMSGLLALLGGNMTQEELDRLRKLFDRFDENKVCLIILLLLPASSFLLPPSSSSSADPLPPPTCPRSPPCSGRTKSSTWTSSRYSYATSSPRA